MRRDAHGRAGALCRRCDVVQAAAILFTLATLGGIALASMHLSSKRVHLWMGMVHGGLALPAIILLFWSTAVSGWPAMFTASLVLFLAAAGGGVVMFFLHGKKQPLPKGLIFGHGTLAVLGYIALLVAMFF